MFNASSVRCMVIMIASSIIFYCRGIATSLLVQLVQPQKKLSYTMCSALHKTLLLLGYSEWTNKLISRCIFIYSIFAGVVLGFVSSEDIVLSETQSGGAVQFEFGVLEGYLSLRVLMNATFFTGT